MMNDIRINDIEKINYLKKSKEPIVLCLGFFDCVHYGHLKLIRLAKGLAAKYKAKASIFTFYNNPLHELYNQKLIYTFNERCQVFSYLGLDRVYYAEFNEKFSLMNKVEFLDKLIKNKNIKAIIVGEDYTFGVNKSGDINFLKNYCNQYNIEILVESLIEYDGQKLSTSQIRDYIKNGEVTKANSLLATPYIISGKVIKGNGIGHIKLYPTANLKLDKDKVKLKSGVYYTRVLINGVSFKSVTSVGEKPTLNDSTYTIETYILYYNKNLYNKEITIIFYERIRDLFAFDNIVDLKNKISEDINFIKKRGEM